MTPAEPSGSFARTARRLTGYLGGQVGVKVLYLFGTVAATRAVGPEGWGVLSAIISAGFIAITAVNLGLNPYLTRELAAGSLPQARLLASAGRFRLGSSLLFAVVAPVLIFLTVPGATLFVLGLLTAYLLADSWSKYFFALLRGRENTRYEVIGNNAEKGVFVAGAALAFLGRSVAPPVQVVAAAFAVGALVKLAVASRGASRVLDHPILPLRYILHTATRLRVMARELRYVRESSDFLLMAVFTTIYFRIDTYMVAALRGASQAGFYSAAYRLVEGLLFVPEGVLVVFSPLLVNALLPGNSREGESAVRRVAALQTAAVGPLVLGLVLEHGWIVATVYGTAFGPSSVVLLWLAPAFAFMGFNFLLGGVLTATYRQRDLLWATVAGVVLNLSLNALLIPRYGALGATVATVVTEALVGLLMLRSLRREVGLAPVLAPAGRIAAWMLLLVGVPSIGLHPYLPAAGRIAVEVGSALLFLVVVVRRGEVPNPLARTPRPPGAP